MLVNACCGDTLSNILTSHLKIYLATNNNSELHVIHALSVCFQEMENV